MKFHGGGEVKLWIDMFKVYEINRSEWLSSCFGYFYPEERDHNIYKRVQRKPLSHIGHRGKINRFKSAWCDLRQALYSHY
jgi:hypothetical protein